MILHDLQYEVPWVGSVPVGAMQIPHKLSQRQMRN